MAVVVSLFGGDGVAARPIRTNTPGTGVFIGSGVLGQLVCERLDNDVAELTGCAFVTDFRYAPATHWVIGAKMPLALDRSLEALGVEESASGSGDLEISAKHRFFRTVGRWSDLHAAVEAGIKLPTGENDGRLDPRLPPNLWARLQPGTGSTDAFVDVVVQRGRHRFVQGAELYYRINGEGDAGYRFGDEVRLNLDAEYIAFPREYTKPGKEVFLVLEASLRYREDDRLRGESIDTGGTEVLLAPGIQYIATEQLLLSVSVQLPIRSSLGSVALESGWNTLVEVRFAF